MLSLCGCDSSDYKKAGALLESGDSQEALEIYEALEEKGGYKESSDKILECKYLMAASAYEDMDESVK